MEVVVGAVNTDIDITVTSFSLYIIIHHNDVTNKGIKVVYTQGKWLTYTLVNM